MTDEILQEVACPNCRNPIDIREHGRHVTCDACGSQFILEGHICPYCQTYHRTEVGFCSQCGQALTRLCHKCNTSNWAGNEYCRQCGGPLDIFEVLHLHTTQATVDRLQEQMQSAHRLKEIERESSQRRMAELNAIEEERQAELRRRRQKQKEQEAKLLMITFGGLAFLLILAILYIILT